MMSLNWGTCTTSASGGRASNEYVLRISISLEVHYEWAIHLTPLRYAASYYGVQHHRTLVDEQRHILRAERFYERAGLLKLNLSNILSVRVRTRGY